MTSPHRFLSNDRNAAAVLDAVVAATSILPAEATAFPLPRARQGTARAIIAGGYTGPDDSLFEIEVVSANGGGLLSAPTFAGAGNGALSDLAAQGVPSQAFTLLLASLGVPTKMAAVDFFGVKLLAKAAGAAGNGIGISVSAAGIVAAPTVYSFLEDVKAGTSELKRPQWDFGSYQLTADGEIDPRTPRLRFGNDPQVYRQYKTFADNDWAYVLDPPIVRDLPSETPVLSLSGGYAVTVTSGAAVEPYSGIVTLFDFLNALRTRSNLIDVQGVVVEDRTPGGMAAEDLPLRTDAYALPASYAGNAKFPGLGLVVAPADAPTEIVTLACGNTDTLGGERWSVSGNVSGAMPDCVTGTLYSNPRGYGFTVPRVIPPATDAPTGKISVKDISFAYRPEGAPSVELCVKPIVAGAKAQAKTVEVVYTKRPVIDDCRCEDAPVTGRLDPKCLGVGIEEGQNMAIAAGYQSRLETLYAWRAAFIGANTAISPAGYVRAARYDIELAELVTKALAGGLSDIFVSAPPPAALAEWDAVLAGAQTDFSGLQQIMSEAGAMPPTLALGTAYTIGDIVYDADNLLTASMKLYWLCMTSGTSGTAAINAPVSATIDFGTTAWKRINAIEAMTFMANRNNGKQPDLLGVGENDAFDYYGFIRLTLDAFNKRYEAKMDYVRALAGLIPKTDAGTKQGSECWRPCEGEFEWRVNGREYLPACTNAPYQSCAEVLDADGETRIVSTQEFGFIIRCACPERLLPGDKFSFTIENDAAPPKTYQVGDTIKIPIIAAAPLELAGGQDGDDTLTWTVRGSAGASWPHYAAPIGAEPFYDHGGLKFRIRQGGVPFSLGDQFQFAVAGGTFRWRRDHGPWSVEASISAGPTALADGLSLTLAPGPAPAFVTGDAWAFDVKQPHAPKLARTPDRGAWRWAGEGADWTAEFTADTAIAAVAIWHDCPPGATFTVSGLSYSGAVLWTRPATYRRGLVALVLEGAAAVADCRRVRLTVAGAPEGSLRWLWCGVPWSPVWPASVTLHESWFMRRGPQAARLIGRGGGGEIAWSVEGDNWLNSQDWADLLALLEYLKGQHDEPFVFVPNFEAPDEARLTRIGADEIDLSDADDFQCDRRLLSVRVPLSAVPQ